MMRLLIALTFAITFTAAILWSQNAVMALDPAAQARQEIEANLAKFETILNEKQDPMVLLDFLHETIDNGAEIKMTINSPSENTGAPSDMVLNKADYINSYLHGPRRIQNYKADIQTLSVSVNAETQIVKSRELFIEQGTAKDPMDVNALGQDFTSRTVCESEYNQDENSRLILKNSVCHTDILYEQNV